MPWLFSYSCWLLRALVLALFLRLQEKSCICVLCLSNSDEISYFSPAALWKPQLSMGPLQALSVKGFVCRSTSPQTFWSLTAITCISHTFPPFLLFSFILFPLSANQSQHFFFPEEKKKREVRTWLVQPEFSASAKINKKCLTESCFPKTRSIFSVMNLAFTHSSQTLAQATGSSTVRSEAVHIQWWRRECSSACFSLLSFPWAEVMRCVQPFTFAFKRANISAPLGSPMAAW